MGVTKTKTPDKTNPQSIYEVKLRPFKEDHPQFPYVLFSSSRFLNATGPTISEPGTG